MSGNETAGERDESSERSLIGLRFVGPSTAETLAGTGIDAAAIEGRRVSYRMLIDADVNPGVAARIRREHSLSWSFEGGEDLDRRSTQIRGLRDDERAWIAASSGDWESRAGSAGDGEGADETGGDEPLRRSTDDGGETLADAERAWRRRSRPEPVTAIEEIDAPLARKLATAGITSVRSLAVADPEEVAESLDLDRDRVAAWHRAADERA